MSDLSTKIAALRADLSPGADNILSELSDRTAALTDLRNRLQWRSERLGQIANCYCDLAGGLDGLPDFDPNGPDGGYGGDNGGAGNWPGGMIPPDDDCPSPPGNGGDCTNPEGFNDANANPTSLCYVDCYTFSGVWTLQTTDPEATIWLWYLDLLQGPNNPSPSWISRQNNGQYDVLLAAWLSFRAIGLENQSGLRSLRLRVVGSAGFDATGPTTPFQNGPYAYAYATGTINDSWRVSAAFDPGFGPSPGLTYTACIALVPDA